MQGAKNIITKATDSITDCLRLFVYLYNTLKMNINGINLINSSVINEKNNGGIALNEKSLTSSPPIIPKNSKTLPTNNAYII